MHEGLRVRGKALKDALDGIPAIKLPDVCRGRLLKLIRGELNFVEKLSEDNICRSSNFGYFEAIVQVLQHPLVTGICSVNQKFSVEGENGEKSHAHVDLVGMYDSKPAWFLASDRNPKRVAWSEIRNRTLQLIQAACANPVVKPACILLYFARGIEFEVAHGLEEHFNAYKLDLEENREVESGEWLLINEDEHKEDSMGNSWISLQKSSPVMYKIDLSANTKSVLYIFDGEVVNISAEDFWHIDEQPDSMFYEILDDINKRWSLGRNEGAKLVNFDTTALIAIVSGISNGMAASVAARSATDLKKNYHSFGRFFRTQALLELQRPFLPEVASILKEKQPIVSRFAWEEFESIVSVIGGPDEKRRASALHACLKEFIVPDCPSERVMSLPLTGKIEEKHKVVFGTGDSMEATTLTANMSFMRAAVSKGMALAFIEHRPLALTRD